MTRGAEERAGTVHVIGAGLAGLAAALSLSRTARPVVVHEAAPHAGGRCRSFHDTVLDHRIDNGNHLLLAANHAALDYLAEVGAAGSLDEGDGPIPFLDLATAQTWTIRLDARGLLRRLMAPIRQVPGARLTDILGLLRLGVAGSNTTVMQALGPGALMERFWRPLTVAVLNTEPEEAAAGLLRSMLRTAMAEGERGFTPLIVRDGLSETFIDPALAVLAERGVTIGFGRRLRAIDRTAERVTALHFPGETIELAPGDTVVLAVPHMAARDLLPEIRTPAAASAIVNAHYRLDAPARLPGNAPLIGLTGGTAHWVFVRGPIASVTVSAADSLVDQPAGELLTSLWRDTATALGLPAEPQPPGRIVKERRATFRQTPATLRDRPPARTVRRNLVLAGDWTDTGQPATIEGAIRSGRTAAGLLGDP